MNYTHTISVRPEDIDPTTDCSDGHLLESGAKRCYFCGAEVDDFVPGLTISLSGPAPGVWTTMWLDVPQEDESEQTNFERR